MTCSNISWGVLSIGNCPRVFSTDWCLMFGGDHLLVKVCGGVSFIKETMNAFNLPTIRTKLVVDMAGYDGFAALATLQVPLSFEKKHVVNALATLEVPLSFEKRT